MRSILKNIFSLSTNPLFKAYRDNRKHRFHNHLIAAAILMVYEVLMLFFSTAHVNGLQNGEIWFQIVSYLPFRSLLVTIGILVWYSFAIRRDFLGILDEKEQKVVEYLELKNISLKAQGQIPITIPPKPKYRINWLHFLRMFCEAFVYAAIIFAFLPYLTEAILYIIAPSTPPLFPQPKQLLYYETTVIQGFAIACGSGFYEEFIFRYHLIKLFNKLLSPRISPVSTPFLLKALDKSKWVHAPRFFFSIIASAVIYSLSHILIPTGDSFHLYFFFYRLLFAFALTWVMTQRKFGIAAMTHTLYGVFYFASI